MASVMKSMMFLLPSPPPSTNLSKTQQLLTLIYQIICGKRGFPAHCTVNYFLDLPPHKHNICQSNPFKDALNQCLPKFFHCGCAWISIPSRQLMSYGSCILSDMECSSCFLLHLQFRKFVSTGWYILSCFSQNNVFYTSIRN